MRHKTFALCIVLIFSFLFVVQFAFAGTPPEPCNESGTPGLCSTAIGTINANTTTNIFFFIFAFTLFIAGFGVVILFMVGGWKIIASHGDKEKIQNARDTITSAVAGLLFIILSIALLQIIGVDILKIPGFVK